MSLRLHARRGTVDRFGSINIGIGLSHAREFNERLEYRHMNPVKKGLVKRPEHWRWSSTTICLGQGGSGGVSHSDRLRARAIGVSCMRKVHGQKIADRWLPASCE